MVLPLPGAPRMRTGRLKRSSRRGCRVRKVVSGCGLTTARKAASSRIYSVALRRKGLAILAVPVPAPEKGTHGRPFLALRLGPEERNAVIGRVMLEDERQRAFGIAPLHVCLRSEEHTSELQSL